MPRFALLPLRAQRARVAARECLCAHALRAMHARCAQYGAQRAVLSLRARYALLVARVASAARRRVDSAYAGRARTRMLRDAVARAFSFFLSSHIITFHVT